MHTRLIDCGDPDQVRWHPPRSHRRHPPERLLPAGDRAAPKEQDDGDEDERNRRAPAWSRHVAGHLRLGDPEGQAGDRRDRKRRETPTTAAARIGMTMKREVFTAQAGDRNQEDRRQPAQCCPYGPVGDGDHVRRNRQRGGGSRILGDGGCGEPELGCICTPTQRTTVRTRTMPKMHSRSSPIGAPKISTEFVGRIDETGRPAAPKMSSTASWVDQEEGQGGDDFDQIRGIPQPADNQVEEGGSERGGCEQSGRDSQEVRARASSDEPRRTRRPPSCP